MSFKETMVGTIPEEWNVDIIDNIKANKKNSIAMGPFGSNIKKENFVESGVPVIRGNNLNGIRLIEEDFVYLTEEKAEKLKASEVNRGDIVITHRGTLGQVSLVPNKSKYEKYIVSQSGMKLTCDREKANSEFINYFLNSRLGQYLLLKNKSQVGVPSIASPTTSLKKVPVPLPSLQEQNAISKVLSDIDNKIEINNKINKNLEEMAQAIFKQWFIDFEFPCVPENYKFSGASKPCNPEGAGKPCNLEGAGKPCNPEEAGKPRDFDKVCTYKRVGGLPIPDGDSWFVYVLLCEDGSFYKGMTKDLYRRFYEHYTGIGAEWTKTHKPVKVIHYEKFNTQEEARKREEELKSGYGREWIKREYKKYQEGLSAHKANSDLSSNQTSMMMAGSPAHQTRLVPAGEMVESEFGMIPKKWRFSNLDEVLTTIEAGNRPKGGSGNLTEGVPSIGAENIIGLGQYDYSKEKYVSVDYFNKMKKGIVKSKDVLLYKDGAQLGRKTFFMDGFPHNKCCINSHVFILRGNESISQEYLYLWLDQYKMTEKIKNLNANSAQPGINQMQVKTLAILLPNKNIIDKVTKIIESLFKVIFNNCKENKKNFELRDTLLPKLMSGEIRVNID